MELAAVLDETVSSFSHVYNFVKRYTHHVGFFLIEHYDELFCSLIIISLLNQCLYTNDVLKVDTTLLDITDILEYQCLGVFVVSHACELLRVIRLAF